jgi:cellulose biosynthesis protein BcsQ
MDALSDHYDAVLFDIHPRISWLQTAGLVGAKNILVPVRMDSQGLQGAFAALGQVEANNWMFKKGISIAGWLPVIVDTRLGETVAVMRSLEELSKRTGIPVLPPIHRDDEVENAIRNKQTLLESGPTSRVIEEYKCSWVSVEKELLDGSNCAA